MPPCMDEMSMDEFSQAMREKRTIIIPVGALEAHGNHLPLGTDMFQPDEVARAVSEMTGALVAPPIPYGNCSSTKRLSGTVSVDAETLRRFVREVLMELGRNGARSIVVLSGHAGASHMAALREAAKDFVERYDCKTLVLSDYDIAYSLKEVNQVPPEDGHAGMIETSRMMAIRPDISAPGDDHIPKREKFLIKRSPEKDFPGGVMGYSSRASEELGRELNEGIARELARIITEG